MYPREILDLRYRGGLWKGAGGLGRVASDGPEEPGTEAKNLD